MTKNEALEKLKRTSVLWESSPKTDFVEAVKLGISALEKQIPKKPTGIEECTCPKCGTHNEIVKRRRNTVNQDVVHCWHCGQALKCEAR